jgi:lipopolysaccharide/colanic/teichoic acid biosynthesis glycosyltransferase
MSPFATEQDARPRGPAPHPVRPEQAAAHRREPRPVQGISFARDLGYRVTIRTLDVVVSATALVLLAPIMLVIALLIRADSPGPVVFRQIRRGRRPRPGTGGTAEEEERLGRPFVLYKFRTMSADARETYPELYRYEHTREEMQTLPIKVLVSRKMKPEEIDRNPEVTSGLVNDPRVTRIGRWLRRTSLDELPNFLSVLRGGMALVGPRPDIAENIRHYSPEHLRKLDVKPGITGLAQIMGRGRLSFMEINDWDVEYVDRQSLRLDLQILFRTVPAVLKRDGAF